MTHSAFVTHPLPNLQHNGTRRKALQCPVMVATGEPNVTSQRVRAPVVDSRIAGVTESHHWIHVTASFARAFERAAAANAGVTAVVEERTGTPARRRWVLRRVADPCLDFLDGAFTTDNATYLVMEQFDAPRSAAEAHTHRWLSAVRRLGPMLGAIDIATLSYDSVFSATRHNHPPTQENAIVVIQSLNARNPQEFVAILKETAQAAVQAGECLEYSVLQSQGAPAVFKTVEVYQDVQALKNARTARVHRAFENRVRGKIVGDHIERQTFKASLLD